MVRVRGYGEMLAIGRARRMHAESLEDKMASEIGKKLMNHARQNLPPTQKQQLACQ
jgi:hypothetical protein